MKTVPRALRLALVLAIVPIAGCQLISAIITSPSDSVSGSSHAIGGSFEAISVSSGSDVDKEKASYERDLREYSASFVRTGGQAADFTRGVSRIATTYGISNWETHKDTADAIGKGLAEASLNEQQVNAFCADTQLSPDLSKSVVKSWKDHT